MEDIKVERPGVTRVRGPLKNLTLNKYKSADTLRYPLNLAADDGQNRMRHYIKFNINIPEKSKYNTQKTLKTTGQLSTADRNRATGFQLGSSADPFSAGDLAKGGTLLAAIDVAAAAGKLFKDDGGVTGLLVETALNVAVLSFVDMQRKTKRLQQQIFLYVPDTVQQKIAMAYDKVSVTDALGKAGFAAQAGQAFSGRNFEVSQMFKDGAADYVGAGRNSSADAFGGVAGESLGMAASATGAFGAGIEKVMLASAGYAKNPQVEVLFNSVSNREFQFLFVFSPQSQAEANMVLDIIKAFKFHSVPELVEGAGGGRYFVPPSEFDIQYYFDGTPNRALHKFSSCVLTSIDVDYSNGKTFATYDDGVPIQIQMTLNFMEVEILHKKLVEDDY
jgi:hypothetical protein